MWTNPRTGKGWTDREESVIAEISEREGVPRPEAIRRMRRRRLDDLKGRICSLAELGIDETSVQPMPRRCRNPRCTRGDDGGRGSLLHLRTDARYCDDACRKAVRRS